MVLTIHPGRGFYGGGNLRLVDYSMNEICNYCHATLEEDKFHPDSCAHCGAPIDRFSEKRMWVVGENNEAGTISVREFLAACNSQTREDTL
jgi:hypothetical protein